VGVIAVLIIVNPRRPLPLVGSPLLVWIFAYFAITTTWGLWMTDGPDAILALRERYRSMGFLLAFFMLFGEPLARRAGVLAVAVVTAFNSFVNIAQSVGLVDFTPMDQNAFGRVPGRSAGFLIDANVAGYAIILGVSIAIVEIPRAWRLPMLLVAAVGVVATFSRGAVICLAVLIIWLMVSRVINTRSVLLVSLAIAASFAIAGSSLSSFLEARNTLNENTWGRLHLTSDDSGRGELALNAWQMFVDAPILGNGLAATNQAHNEYLRLAGDHGFLGLILLPALGLALCLRNPKAVPFAVALMASGMFSHTVLDDRASLLGIALAAANYRSPRTLGAVEMDERRSVPVG
jgi:hypothetical protein